MRFIIFLITLSAFVLVEAKPSGDSNWWKHGVFYQVYPRSFKDQNNDGIGDLIGITEKLPYLADTGLTAIWLSPIFESPQVDQGYDISNYTKVDPSYGTNDDLKRLIERAHELGLKVILDFVPNHTSDKHQWFVDSENRVEGFEDFYVWLDGKVDENGVRVPPNNWVSLFKNSSWQWSEKRQQYYLHQFAIAQPDLNYRNPKLVQTMKEVLRFWLDHGVDGFRIDAVPYLIEEVDFLDEPESGLPGFSSQDYEHLDHIYTANLQGTYDVIYDWRQFLDEYTAEHGGDQRIMMTEAYAGNLTALYYGTPDGSRLGAHFSFNFKFISNVNANSTAADFAKQIRDWQNELPSLYTSNWVIGNHDNRRAATRFGPRNVDGFNMLVALLPGIQVTYNGEEIGQEDGEVSFEEGQDPSARDPAIFERVSRDFERTPFHWDTSVNAGFNEGAKPWLPVSEKYLETNLASQIGKESHYSVYTRMLRLRQFDACLFGTTDVDVVNDDVLVLKRELNKNRMVLLFNLGDDVQAINVEQHVKQANLVIEKSVGSQFKTMTPVDPALVELQPHEAIVILS